MKVNVNKLEMTSCIKCGNDMPLLRFTKYGYRSCVNCSTTQRVGGVAIANHKTGNEIQILPMEDAVRLNNLAARQGYGVSRGVKGSYKK